GRSACSISSFSALLQQCLLQNGAYRPCLSPRAPAGTSSIAGGTQHQLMRAGLGFRGVTHVLLTHAHLDHVLGLAGLLATFALYRVDGTIEIVGSDETLAFVKRYLADTIGPEREGSYRLRAISPGP